MVTKSMKVYIPNPVHRDPASGHSQWSVSESDEFLCFSNSDEHKWVGDERGWGLHDLNGAIGMSGRIAERVSCRFMQNLLTRQDREYGMAFPLRAKIAQVNRLWRIGSSLELSGQRL